MTKLIHKSFCQSPIFIVIPKDNYVNKNTILIFNVNIN